MSPLHPDDMLLTLTAQDRYHLLAERLKRESVCVNNQWLPWTPGSIEREQLAQRRNAKWHRLKEKERMG